jgi:hypothetical protein
MEGEFVGCIGRATEGASLERSEGKSEADCVGDNVPRVEGRIVGTIISMGTGWLVSEVGAGLDVMGARVRDDAGDIVGSEESATMGLIVGRIVGFLSVRNVGVAVGESIGCIAGGREGTTVGILNARSVRYRSQSSRSSSAMGKPCE